MISAEILSVGTELLLGEDTMTKLGKARVIIFGIGGVGGYALEALVRSGIGSITCVDMDTVSASNINRQIIATEKTVGRKKVDVAMERALEINPDIEFTALPLFYTEENAQDINLADYDYVIDAIDTVKSKIALIVNAAEKGVPIISSMGTGNKLDPTKFKVSDIHKTSVCPLARVIRTELKRRGIKKLKCVYSEELPRSAVVKDENSPKTRHSPASMATTPAVAGLIIASEVIRDLSEK